MWQGQMKQEKVPCIEGEEGIETLRETKALKSFFHIITFFRQYIVCH